MNIALDNGPFSVHLYGPFRILRADGSDITPGGEFQKAILAYLLSARNQTVSRSVLHSIFWAASEPQRAAGSLRSAIKRLRDDFSAMDVDPIISTKSYISLRPGVFTTPTEPTQRANFLEGINLNLSDDEEFEDWLREMRYDDDILPIPIAPQQTAPQDTAPKSSGSIGALGILPFEMTMQDQDARHIGDQFLDTLQRKFVQSSLLQIYDLRGRKAGPQDITNLGGEKSGMPTASVLLRPSIFKSRDCLNLRLTLQEPSTGRVIWAFDPIDLYQDDSETLGNHIFEIVLHRLMDLSSDQRPVNLLPWAALSSLFSLDSQAIKDTEIDLTQILQAYDNPMIQCLLHFAQVFKENEGFGEHTNVSPYDLASSLEQVSVSDPLRPLCESLVGYSAHMLMAENDFGSQMVENAFLRAPKMALNLDHLAVLRLSAGDIAGAEKAFKRCIADSKLSSWRYSYEVTGAMIAMAKGDFKTSLFHANRSLMLQPKFIGGLRYAMIGFALNNNVSDAFRMRKRLTQLRPDFDMSNWFDNFLSRADRNFANNAAVTLRDYQLI